MILDKPEYMASSPQFSTFCSTFSALQPYITSTPYTYEEIMGYTGHAFHINIQTPSINKWGPFLYDWDGILQHGLANLGVYTNQVSYSGYNEEVLNALEHGIEIIKNAIQNGYPAMVWEAIHPEFALIYGYDEEKKIFYAIDSKSEATIPFKQLGQGEETSEFYVLTVNDSADTTFAQRLKGAIHLILQYGNQENDDNWEFISGLEAYDAWIDAFEKGNVDTVGNAYNIQVNKHARTTAVEFLEKISDELGHASTSKAIDIYKKIVKDYEALEALFPDENNKDPQPDDKEQAIILLNQLRDQEEQGLEAMKELLYILS